MGVLLQRPRSTDSPVGMAEEVVYLDWLEMAEDFMGYTSTAEDFKGPTSTAEDFMGPTSTVCSCSCLKGFTRTRPKNKEQSLEISRIFLPSLKIKI